MTASNIIPLARYRPFSPRVTTGGNVIFLPQDKRWLDHVRRCEQMLHEAEEAERFRNAVSIMHGSYSAKPSDTE